MRLLIFGTPQTIRMVFREPENGGGIGLEPQLSLEPVLSLL